MKTCDICGKKVRKFKYVPEKYLEENILDVCEECSNKIISEVRKEVKLFNKSTKSKIKNLIKGL